MALQKLLGLLLIVIDYSSVSGAVEDLSSVFCRQVMNALVDVFVKTNDPLEVEGGHTVSLFLGSLLAVVVVLHISPFKFPNKINLQCLLLN